MKHWNVFTAHLHAKGDTAGIDLLSIQTKCFFLIRLCLCIVSNDKIHIHSLAIVMRTVQACDEFVLSLPRSQTFFYYFYTNFIVKWDTSGPGGVKWASRVLSFTEKYIKNMSQFFDMFCVSFYITAWWILKCDWSKGVHYFCIKAQLWL